MFLTIIGSMCSVDCMVVWWWFVVSNFTNFMVEILTSIDPITSLRGYHVSLLHSLCICKSV